ncbi:RNA polymerase II transcription subunit 5 mediator [Nannizzia gypsea CBS 118893]|uniref:Mediator of RNA polymerase II transcription subunit 5 n=1 Tax=Arthroderma gypseum (strain ATCC MYA-4604 / CBS 118893) TaxID=535722 RepID=E5R3Y4_ARTGP|nr:RNA polymerase II transcription subunit 5 mediator [Nannizzia gypsea CBS 118893]EFQ98830.1 RNA polymerase II transcription subunit 5 mediator [Nannizzia gypsea CBS 118893]
MVSLLKRPSGASRLEWQKFLQQCVLQRISTNEFHELAKVMLRRHPVPHMDLFNIILESRAVTDFDWDPLIPDYVDAVQKLTQVDLFTILPSLLAHSSIKADIRRWKKQNHTQNHDEKPKIDEKGPTEPAGSQGPATLLTDYGIMQNVITAVTTGHSPKTALGFMDTCSAIADWILALVSWNAHLGSEKGEGSGTQLLGTPDVVSIFIAVGFLFGALAGTEVGANALSFQHAETFKHQRTKLARALTAYSPICAEISIPLRNRLDQLQKEFNIFLKDEKSNQDHVIEDTTVSTMEFESRVVDIPPVSSRAGLYIYVNSLLVGRPLIDDNLLINYLNNRYGGNHMALVEELITASFDVLSNGMYRNEPQQTMFLFRAFLVNKLPPFLSDLAGSVVEPIPVELCITRALARVDPNTFPSFSEIFSTHGNSVLSDVRQEFLFSCALHKLIPESSIERLLGENPMQTLPNGGRFIKHDLVSQINNNHERAEQLLNGIESMDGNARAIVEAIAEVMHNMCLRKDTMTLKSLCNSLSRRPQALDIMLLFKSPQAILQPLCALLDSWKWDEDQVESQPVYDEFGSVLLLVLAFKYKYDLSYQDLGVFNPDSFMCRLLEKGASSQKLEDLTEKQQQNLGAWITALFIAEGISDESMSSCSPQEFYLLVATLFCQSLSACEAGKLEFDTLKGGFELHWINGLEDLLEPFLLPSLVMALSWIGKHIWKSGTDLTTTLRLLATLVKPTSISGEAQEIHRTVLSITARALADELRTAKTRHPSRTDIDPILQALEPYQSFQRTGTSNRAELEGWRSSSAPGGMVTGIRNTFSSLVLWSTDPEISMTPPSYTHRQLLAGLKHLGSVRVLVGILEELKLQSETGSGDLAIDIAATLICAPMGECFSWEQATYQSVGGTLKDSLPRSQMLNLRDALNLQRESLAKMIESEPHRAELVIRLARRVDALTSIPQIPQAVDNIDVGNIMADMDLTGVEEDGQMQLDVGQQAEQQGQQQQNLATTGTDATHGTLDAILDAATAEGVTGPPAGSDVTMAQPDIDASIFDDMLNPTDMGVGNPEFIDLDMEGMF